PVAEMCWQHYRAETISPESLRSLGSDNIDVRPISNFQLACRFGTYDGERINFTRRIRTTRSVRMSVPSNTQRWRGHWACEGGNHQPTPPRDLGSTGGIVKSRN